jgi:preprotein translocase subunit SecD
MKRNGFKILLTLGFLLLTGWYLFPSIQNLMLQRELDSLEGQELTDYRAENFSRIRAIEDKSLNLGLDLLGGMHVGLEVRVDALIRELARERDAEFDAVLEAARAQATSSDASVIDAFVETFEERNPEVRLSRYFRNEDAGITRRSTNEEVATYLNTQVDEAVDRAISIIRDRVDRFGVTEPSIARQGTRRVIVELPGVDDAERVRRLLRGTAQLQFRLMAEPSELLASLQNILDYYESDDLAVEADSADVAEAADTTLSVDELLAGGDEASSGNALRDIMTPVGRGVEFGAVAESDTAAVRELLSVPAVQAMLPQGVTLMYTASPPNGAASEAGEEIYFLLGVRDAVELTGEVVTDASVQFNELNQAEVSMSMNSEGARDWARLTGANVNKSVAIVLDNVVYSYPVIRGRIAGGRTSIEGLDSQAEASDIVTILKSGALPAPVEIIEERTVGPSLGAASIRAGLNSVLIGLLVVALFMIVYYRTAGIVADLALILNLIFILGILAGFQATLTLPGIAGVVLTIGMAVDANVLIFDRVREEMRAGRTLKAAVEGGYAKALSAILDANITTFFVAVILFSFGVGPIQGFAVTLMAGILSSLFTAIIFTRIIFDWLILDRQSAVKFG